MPEASKDHNPALLAARSRYSQALQQMQKLANASIGNPELEADYQRAVADVAAAEAALQEVAQ